MSTTPNEQRVSPQSSSSAGRRGPAGASSPSNALHPDNDSRTRNDEATRARMPLPAHPGLIKLPHPSGADAVERVPRGRQHEDVVQGDELRDLELGKTRRAVLDGDHPLS